MSRLLAALLALSLAAPAAAELAPAKPESDAVAPAADDAIAQLSRRMSGRLEPILRDPCLRNARLGVVVRELSTGRVLFTQGADEPLAPASNQKLLTAAALESLLGPEHVRRTEFRAERSPDAAGAVGALHVVGYGDPALTVEALYGAARALASAGVRSVSAVVADDSYFEGPGRVPSWPTRNDEEWYGAPSSALSCNFNVVAVHARGAGSGQAAEAWLDPFPTYFELANGLVTGRGPWSARCEALDGSTSVACQRVTLTGRVPVGKTVRELRAVEDPALFCAHGVAESLQRVGIRVEGPISRGKVPAKSVLLHAHASKPLALLVHDMNKESSNVFAETLLKVLGAEVLGRPGTREKGLAVVEAFLRQVSARTAACRVVDGSGLSPDNRITAGVLTDLLVSIARDPYTYPELVSSLPVGGVDGTLRRRLDDGPARRLVRAKTGRIQGVVALSGYARVDDTREAVFSVLVNEYHCPTWKAQDAVDRLVEAMVADAPPAPEPRQRLPLAGVIFAPPPPEAAAVDADVGEPEHEGSQREPGGS